LDDDDDDDDDDVDISRAYRKYQASATENLGFNELKQYKPRFDG
jgi:hypothetical protein